MKCMYKILGLVREGEGYTVAELDLNAADIYAWRVEIGSEFVDCPSLVDAYRVSELIHNAFKQGERAKLAEIQLTLGIK